MSARKVSLMFLIGLLCGLAFFLPAAWMKGYRVYVIHTGSMEPTLRLGTLVIDKPARDGYRPGDVITFRHSGLTTDVVTHRITDITATGLIHTKGDANATADVWDIRPNQVEGVRDFTIPKVGYLVVFLQRPSGVAALLVSLFALVMLWGLFFPSADLAAAVRKHRHRAARGSVTVASLRHAADERPRPDPSPGPASPISRTVSVDDAPTTVLSHSDVATLRELIHAV